MGHKWISTDNGVHCYRCGLVIDYRQESDSARIMGSDAFEDYYPGAEDDALGLAPDCSGPETERAHHLVLATMPDTDVPYLECAYGDAAGDEIRLGPAPFEPECVGA